MKILIDGEYWSASGHISELLATAGLNQDGIKRRATVDGGASPHAVKIANKWGAAADRGLAAVSHVRHQNATLEADQPESVPESRTGSISVNEAADRHHVDPRTILRWLHNEPSMIASEHPYRLDPIPLDAYAAERPRSRRAA